MKGIEMSAKKSMVAIETQIINILTRNGGVLSNDDIFKRLNNEYSDRKRGGVVLFNMSNKKLIKRRRLPSDLNKIQYALIDQEWPVSIRTTDQEKNRIYTQNSIDKKRNEKLGIEKKTKESVYIAKIAHMPAGMFSGGNWLAMGLSVPV